MKFQAKVPPGLIYIVQGGFYGFSTAMVFTFIAVYYVETAGFNPLQLVLIGTVLEIAVFVFEIPTGIVADLYSRRLSVIIGICLIGITFVVEALVPIFVYILAMQIIRGIGHTFVSGALEAWLADEVGEENLAGILVRGSQVSQVAGMAGILVGMGLANVQVNLPVFAGGVILMVLAVGLALLMPESGFCPAPKEDRSSWQQMQQILQAGIKIVQQRPVLLILVSVSLFYGLSSEGVDRLWEVHMLKNFVFPDLGSLKPITWFGLINLGAIGINVLALGIARRGINMTDPWLAARALIWIDAFVVIAILVLGLTGQFALAVSATWTQRMLRTIGGPISSTWINQGLDPRVRATVLSMKGQVDALGQMIGGPLVGWIGTVWSTRAALATSALLLAPVLLMYWLSMQYNGRQLKE